MKRVTCRCGKADAANQLNLKSGPAELNPDVALYPGYFDDAPSGSNLLQNGGKVAIPSPRMATESPYSSPLDGVPRLLGDPGRADRHNRMIEAPTGDSAYLGWNVVTRRVEHVRRREVLQVGQDGV